MNPFSLHHVTPSLAFPYSYQNTFQQPPGTKIQSLDLQNQKKPQYKNMEQMLAEQLKDLYFCVFFNWFLCVWLLNISAACRF